MLHLLLESRTRGDYEGFNYLGSGVLLLTLFALIPLLESRTAIVTRIKGKPFLFLGLLALSIFSLSNRIGVQTIWFEVPLPDTITKVAGIFKSSGRFFWPVFYMIYLAVFYLLARGFSKQVAITLLSLGALVQVLDTSAYWTTIRDTTMENRSGSWNVRMDSRFWEKAATIYEKTRSLPVANMGQNWQEISYYSGIHKLPTSAVYLARLDPDGLATARKATKTMMDSGRYQPDTLYFVKEALLPVVSRNLDPNNDLLARIDGYYVIAPQWKECKTCPRIEGELDYHGNYSLPISFGKRVAFGHNKSGNSYLDDGWSHPESWGVWSDGGLARLTIPIADGEVVERVVFEGHPLLGPSLDTQRIGIHVNGAKAEDVTLTESDGETFAIKLTETMKDRVNDSGAVKIRFVLPDATSPSELGLNEDTRTLAFGLESVTVEGR